MATPRMKPQVIGTQIVADARRYLGIPYKFGGGPQNPRAGLDCSGLVERVALDVGITSCPRTSEEQWTWSEHTNDPSEGDLVFFVGSDGEPGSPGHVGIVITPGTMINAPFTGTVVRVDHYSMSGSGPNAVVGFGAMQGATMQASSGPSKVSQQQNVMEGGVAAGGIMAGIITFLLIVLAFLILGFLIMRQL